ncbi:GNAT family N-acetyltransferase [Chryseobacterium jejuense]|uniref:FR47-like protein n=1 Tax=Chryseobacterium jejuense TaxID=445960 RepID=A0A2X2X2B3_CHRJE|nr:GNAT family N-acetyltransferase [Chryseobacterium jejuense]SDI30607.1 GNAT acetyltransferase [Chryseobacterium jejuense]SQB44711.1 FR47-like protein [Chryseobacterium jejuense]
MHTSKITSPIVQEYWKDQFQGEILCNNSTFILFLNDDLEEDSQIMTLEFPSGISWATINSKAARYFKNTNLTALDFEKFVNTLKDKEIFLYGADYIFYFPEEEKANILNLGSSENTRPLTEDDAEHFSMFESLSTEEDLDGAFVELDHWKVYGIFENNQLVAATSMYPWQDTQLSDIGVITLDQFRGKGYAKQAVAIISKAALEEGYEPQYRCQLDNTASVALAKKLNLSLFAKWNFISPESIEKL